MMTIELVALAVTLTAYQPIPSQTDSSPTWTSIGDRTTKFGCAVSQDLLKSGRVKYGDVLHVPGWGYRVVNDTMNARHTNAVDLLVFTLAEEKKVGVRRITVYKLGEPHELRALSKLRKYAKPKNTQGITQQRVYKKQSYAPQGK